MYEWVFGWGFNDGEEIVNVEVVCDDYDLFYSVVYDSVYDY